MNETLDKQYTDTIILKCNNCGGHLEVMKENETAHCPYCGMSELLVESDEIVIERIRSKTYKDIASEKIQSEKELELTKLQLLAQEKFAQKLAQIRKSPLTFIIAFLTIAAFLGTIVTYRLNYKVSAIFIGCQALLFFVVWLMRMRFLKGSGIYLHSLLSLLAVLMTIPFFMFFGVEHKNYDSYVWQQNNLTTMLPKPKSEYGEIKRDAADEFVMLVGRVKESDFNTYVEACIEKGFHLKIYRSEWTFNAYNQSGESLKVVFTSYLSEMEITLTAKEVLNEYLWPDRGLSTLLPEPVSDVGIINTESEYLFRITVAKTSIADYNQYVNACIEAGFAEHMLLSENQFYSENSEGVVIEIDHDSNDVMEITVYIPQKAED